MEFQKAFDMLPKSWDTESVSTSSGGKICKAPSTYPLSLNRSKEEPVKIFSNSLYWVTQYRSQIPINQSILYGSFIKSVSITAWMPGKITPYHRVVHFFKMFKIQVGKRMMSEAWFNYLSDFAMMEYQKDRNI